MKIDNVSPLKSIDGGRKIQDPFEEAYAEIESSGEANQEQEVDAVVPESVEAPEPIQTAQAKPKKASTGRGVAFTAMGVSLIAIVSSGYSVLSQQGMQGEIHEQITSVETYVTDLRLLTETMTTQVSANTDVIANNSSQVQSLSDLRGEMMVYNSVLDQMKSEVLSMRGSVVQGQELLGTQRSAVHALTGRVSSLESKPIKTTTTVYREPTPVTRADVDITKIEGASLASIDAWGSQTNVMLRDENGDWVSLLQGDFYEGWQLISASGNMAEFKKGKNNRTIKVEG